MGKEKTPLTAEQLYKKNQRKAKVLKKLAPVVFWIFIAFAGLFMILTVKNSFGNIVEIINLLDKDTFTGEQISKNYAELVERYGEWTIAGGDENILAVRFVDIRNALFSGLMIAFLIVTVICLAAAVVVGKVVFPKLAQLYSDNNRDMVDIATLQTNAEIKIRKGWF